METLAQKTVVTEILETSIFSDLKAAIFGSQDIPPAFGSKGKMAELKELGP